MEFLAAFVASNVAAAAGPGRRIRHISGDQMVTIPCRRVVHSLQIASYHINGHASKMFKMLQARKGSDASARARALRSDQMQVGGGEHSIAQEVT